MSKDDPIFRKPVFWIGDSLETVQKFPDEVKSEIGYAIDVAQRGGKDRNTKPLSGFGGASVLEVVSRFDTNTYRAVYTVQIADAIYVLHCFQKKSSKGIATPKPAIDLIKKRLQTARLYHDNQE